MNHRSDYSLHFRYCCCCDDGCTDDGSFARCSGYDYCGGNWRSCDNVFKGFDKVKTNQTKDKMLREVSFKIIYGYTQ